MAANSARTYRSTSRSRRVTGPVRQSPSAPLQAATVPSGSGSPGAWTPVLARRTASFAYDERFTTVLTCGAIIRRPLPRIEYGTAAIEPGVPLYHVTNYLCQLWCVVQCPTAGM